MNIVMLNPVWLKTFKTLVDVGHFTKTAETLFMTQPGVSQHIRKLEQACGYDLIIRDKKSFELTEQGRLVYVYANQVEKNEQALIENLSFDNPYSGECRLSCSGSLALMLYPALLTLQQKFPELTVSLEAAPNQRILQNVQEGNMDIGIVTHIPSQSQFDVEEVGQEPLCFILPKRFEDKVIDGETLSALGMIRHPDAEHYFSLFSMHCGMKELEVLNAETIPSAGYVNQLSQILLPVSMGIGFTVLPQSSLQSFAEREKLYVLEPRKEVHEVLYLVTKRHRQLPERFNTLIEAIKPELHHT